MDKSKRNSGECHEIGGMAPQVLNILNGVRYCGRRGELAFKDFVSSPHHTVPLLPSPPLNKTNQ